MPSLYIITGSNGAGKSTVGPEYLPKHIHDKYPVFDGDLLFVAKQRELFPAITRSPKEAKKIAFQHVVDTFEKLADDALTNNDNFVYEGHFTNSATWDTPKRFKAAGYAIHLFFLGLTSPDLSQLRVADRVTEGGHYVDRSTIEANFIGNLEMLNINFRFIDHLTIVDTSEIHHITLATLTSGIIVSSIPVADLPGWFVEYLPAINAIIH
ncbi:zeta toxin family protein [Mucilaginibacter flavidus]|uniref:zeta toxin family protein n=1 Tax=Mucilaginibacter flavidus TaxID=2949309 RepID=UPI00209340D6|nr:zeta toxin family protein [Mucilaginibacter flavidus]MCO5945999.1 zeta toxin family protein [Mucilaginibacter flavidus]